MARTGQSAGLPVHFDGVKCCPLSVTVVEVATESVDIEARFGAHPARHRRALGNAGPDDGATVENSADADDGTLPLQPSKLSAHLTIARPGRVTQAVVLDSAHVPRYRPVAFAPTAVPPIKAR